MHFQKIHERIWSYLQLTCSRLPLRKYPEIFIACSWHISSPCWGSITWVMQHQVLEETDSLTLSCQQSAKALCTTTEYCRCCQKDVRRLMGSRLQSLQAFQNLSSCNSSGAKLREFRDRKAENVTFQKRVSA